LKNNQSTQILSEEIDEALAVIAKVENSRELESLRVDYLGRRGSITGKLKQIGELPPEERKAYGQAIFCDMKCVL
jgi:phenylalanyl-tRNA synthetase alpha chain